jgi:spermidine dehydrogenase
VSYVRDGRVFNVRSRHCVLACYNMMIPHLTPDLPEAQKRALHELVKAPLVYTSVALRNWTSLHRLKVGNIYSPGSYHFSLSLNPQVNIGAYRSSTNPEEPMLVQMERAPCAPGRTAFEQNRLGRAELLATPFSVFEYNVRDQLARMLGGAGLDPAKDILGITVNRWAHGYAPEFNVLFDPLLPLEQQPHVIGRARFGNITIANSDSARAAYTDAAIEQAHRAVNELKSA